MVRNFSADDEGKSVMTKDGKTVGTVEKTTDTEIHVQPKSGLSQSIRRRLGWAEKEQENFSVRKSDVDRITDDEIRLKQ